MEFDELFRGEREEPVPENYCADCRAPMEIVDFEYRCETCGRTAEYFETQRVESGGNCIIYYNIPTDYSKTQIKSILAQLNRRSKEYQNSTYNEPGTVGFKTQKVFMPQDVLVAAAEKYNQIQRNHAIGDAPKKFVKRGSIKDEILATLIYFEGIRRGVVRKRTEVAKFMRLPTCGFSRGEDVVRDLHAKEQIDCIVDEPAAVFIECYIESLGVAPKFAPFLCELVDRSEALNLSKNSRISSKCAGAIYMLIRSVGLDISAPQLERAIGGTKKNTFMKFCNTVREHKYKFLAIYSRHGIPYADP